MCTPAGTYTQVVNLRTKQTPKIIIIVVTVLIRVMMLTQEDISKLKEDVGISSRLPGDIVYLIPAATVDSLNRDQAPNPIDNNTLLDRGNHTINTSFYHLAISTLLLSLKILNTHTISIAVPPEAGNFSSQQLEPILSFLLKLLKRME